MRKKVLIVSDNPAVIENFTSQVMLHSIDCALTVSTSSDEALAELLGSKTQPDMLIVDGDSPSVNVSAMLNVVRNYFSLQKIRIFVLSAQSVQPDFQEIAACLPPMVDFSDSSEAMSQFRSHFPARRGMMKWVMLAFPVDLLRHLKWMLTKPVAGALACSTGGAAVVGLSLMYTVNSASPAPHAAASPTHVIERIAAMPSPEIALCDSIVKEPVIIHAPVAAVKATSKMPSVITPSAKKEVNISDTVSTVASESRKPVTYKISVTPE